MVLRACELLIAGQDKSRAIFIDSRHKEEIMEYLLRSDKHRNKFRYISELILKNIRMPDVYDKEQINEKCRNVTAMKFFKGGSNDRIYCKEIRSGKTCFIVVMAVLHEKKKSQKNKATEISKIMTVAGYDYAPQLNC